MTQPPAGGPGAPDADGPGWRAPEEPAAPGGVPGVPAGGWGTVAPPSWGSPTPQAWAPPPPQAGIVPLRPLTVGEILDGSFQAIRSNARTMIGTAAVVVAVVTLLSIVPEALLLHRLAGNPALDPGRTAPSLQDQLDLLAGLGQSQATSLVLTFVAVTMLDALLIVPVSEAVLGRRMDAAAMWRRARGRLPGALGLAVVTLLVAVVVWVAVLVPGIVALVAGSDALGVVLLLAGGLGGIVLVVVLYVRWSLAAPALVLEQIGVRKALGRSWRLVGGSSWRVLGILLLAGIITTIGQAALTLPASWLADLVGSSGSTQYASLGGTFLQLLVTGIGTIVAGAVFYPFSAAVSALLYIDLRMRREGLDVRLARSIAERGA